MIALPDGEPVFGPWRVVRLERFVELVLEEVGARLVAYRPPAWEQRARPGAIEVPAGARLGTWERAFAVVAGTPELPFDPTTEVVLGSPAEA